MHYSEGAQGFSDIVQQAIEIAHAEASGANPIVHPITLSICDVDIPVIVANGDVYVQATLPQFFDAMSAQVVEFLRSLEARVSEARRAALAYADNHPELGIPAVVIGDVVRDRGERG